MRQRLLWLVAIAATPALLAAQDTTTAHGLPPVVSVTRDAPRSSLDIPAAVTVTTPDSERPGEPHTSADQLLFDLPGVTVANRTNPSQDVRIAIRGFGARSQFGVRSLRIFRDGMPLTMPDGQTPLDYLDMESVGRVEVLRGSAAALYGNASGGVIDIASAPPSTAPLSAGIRTWAGSDGLVRLAALTSGTVTFGDRRVLYEGNVGHLSSSNYRAYSDQRLTNGYARVAFDAGRTEYAMSILGLDTPVAQNPGALTRAQFDADPRLADSASVAKRSRKEVDQLQLGLSAHHTSGTGTEWLTSAYGATRSLFNPQTFAVVGVHWGLGGASARFTKAVASGENAWRFTVGAEGQYENDFRKNWANCDALKAPTTSCPVLGVESGAITLAQREIVASAGSYASIGWARGEWNATATLRGDWLRFEAGDRYLGDGSDDSGTRTFGAVSPLAGVAYRWVSWLSSYANVSTALESPTLTELGNKQDGTGGLNPALSPQRSVTGEIGVKAASADGRASADIAVFHTAVHDELIPFQATDGRTYYMNAGSTRRDGVEVSGERLWGPVRFDGSYAFSHFRFHEFIVGSTSYAGNTIPGVPEHDVQGSATVAGRPGFAVIEVLGKSAVWANDANLARAPGFAIANVRVGASAWRWGHFEPVLGVQNIFNTSYVGSVAVNATGATVAATKFYEPAPGRTLIVGLEAGVPVGR